MEFLPDNLPIDTTLLGDIPAKLGGLLPSQLTPDTVVILVLAAAFFVHSLRYGKERIISLILALYIALLVFMYFPYTEKLVLLVNSRLSDLVLNAIIFGAFVVIGHLTIAPLLRDRYASSRTSSPLENLLLSASAVSLLIAFAYHVLPIAELYPLNDSIEMLFAPSRYFFWWLVAPLIVIFIFGRR